MEWSNIILFNGIFFKIILPILMKETRYILGGGGNAALFGDLIRVLPKKNKNYFNKGNFQHFINIFIFPNYMQQQSRLHPP